MDLSGSYRIAGSLLSVIQSSICRAASSSKRSTPKFVGKLGADSGRLEIGLDLLCVYSKAQAHLN